MLAAPTLPLAPMLRTLRLAPLALVLTTASLAAQTPEFTREELAARRTALAERIGDGVVVAFGGRALVNDYGTFFQLPAFRYLTALNEPDAGFVMVVRNKVAQSTLFLSPIDARRVLYEGARIDSTTAVARTGIAGRPFSAMAGVLDSLAATGLAFYHVPDVSSMDFARNDSLTRGQQTISALGVKYPQLAIRNAMPHVLALRAKKSAAEIALIRRAAEISTEGHRAAMLTANPQHEFELRAALEYEFTRRGAERPAYGSIVGAGQNGTTLHYMRDADPVKAGDLVVMDAAAEFRGYAADITRTIPVSGTFTKEQRQIYQLVLDAQRAAEALSKPGMSVRAATDSSVALRTRGLTALGLIASDTATFDPPWRVDCAASPLQCRQANLWMIHGITHGIGLEVHDPLQGAGASATFQIGDAFTIEPGIYVSTRSLDMLPDTPKNRAFIARVKATVLRYQNTGVRIEDDYIITERGLERISLVPREIDEIEALMKRRRAITP